MASPVFTCSSGPCCKTWRGGVGRGEIGGEEKRRVENERGRGGWEGGRGEEGRGGGWRVRWGRGKKGEEAVQRCYTCSVMWSAHQLVQRSSSTYYNIHVHAHTMSHGVRVGGTTSMCGWNYMYKNVWVELQVCVGGATSVCWWGYKCVLVGIQAQVGAGSPA